MTDYYKILELSRKATREDISSAFERLAKKYHPMNSKIDMATNAQQFAQVCEAFEVLSNPKFKAIFDAYGEKVLKHGFDPEKKMNFEGVYQYRGNAHDIFNNYFGTSEASKDRFEEDDPDLPTTLNQEELEVRKPQPMEDLEITIDVTINEIFTGVIKKDVQFKRKYLQKDGRNVVVQDVTKTIEIPSGKDHTKPICFKGEGNEGHLGQISDLIVHLNLLQHPNFKRKGNDLIYIYKLTLIEALKGGQLQIVTLDGRYLNISVEVATPQTEIKIKDEGFPFIDQVEIDDPDHETVENEGKKIIDVEKIGFLYVKFNIEFPKQLDSAQKSQFIKALNNELD